MRYTVAPIKPVSKNTFSHYVHPAFQYYSFDYDESGVGSLCTPGKSFWWGVSEKPFATTRTNSYLHIHTNIISHKISLTFAKLAGGRPTSYCQSSRTDVPPRPGAKVILNQNNLDSNNVEVKIKSFITFVTHFLERLYKNLLTNCIFLL